MVAWNGSSLARAAALLTTLIAACALSAPTASGVAAQAANSTASSKRYIGYFIAWGIYGRNYQPSNVPASKLTHINYAFANIANGELALGDPYADIDKAFPGDVWDTTVQPFRGNFWQLNRVIKKKNPGLKTLISVGGWTWSRDFSDVALTDASRKKFARSCNDFITKYGFDGVDIDWEYPITGGLPGNIYRPEDGANYVLLLQAIRDAIGADKQLSIAAPASPIVVRGMKLLEMSKIWDFVNLMTYDFRGGWSLFTGHQSPLFVNPANPEDTTLSTSTVVQYYLEQGVPAAQIVVGVGFYGRGWVGVPSNNNGLFQKYTTVPQGSWDDGQSGATGVFDYKDIKKRIAAGSLKRYYDSITEAPYVYGPSPNGGAGGMMISYDDPESIKAKTQFVVNQGLGGIMTWELTGDDNDELTNVIVLNLGVTPPKPVTSTSVLSSTTTSAATSATSASPSTSATGTSATSASPSTSATQTSGSTPTVTGSASSGSGTATATNTGSVPQPTCIVNGAGCTFGSAPSTCSGGNIAVCNTNNQWLIVPCAKDTTCVATNGQPQCVWSPGTFNVPPESCKQDSTIIFTQTSTGTMTTVVTSSGVTSTATITVTSTATSTSTAGPAPTCPATAPKKNDPCMAGMAETCGSKQEFATCNHGKWTFRKCAQGTVCKRKFNGGFICDFESARADEQSCPDGISVVKETAGSPAPAQFAVTAGALLSGLIAMVAMVGANVL